MRTRTAKPRYRRGATLMEMAICITIMVILLAMTVPSFTRVREQNHVDAAAQYLRSIWCAERVYWLEHRTFTSALADLNAIGLIDPKLAAANDGYFAYEITDVTADEFTVTATRVGTNAWSGSLT